MWKRGHVKGNSSVFLWCGLLLKSSSGKRKGKETKRRNMRTKNPRRYQPAGNSPSSQGVQQSKHCLQLSPREQVQEAPRSLFLGKGDDFLQAPKCSPLGEVTYCTSSPRGKPQVLQFSFADRRHSSDAEGSDATPEPPSAIPIPRTSNSPT